MGTSRGPKSELVLGPMGASLEVSGRAVLRPLWVASGSILSIDFLGPGKTKACQVGPASERKQGTVGARCAEPSEARLRAADESMVVFAIVKASEGSKGEGELQSATLLPGSVKWCFVSIPLARFPFLLSQVFVLVVKPLENHTF